MLRIDGDILVFRAGFASEKAKYRLHWIEHGKMLDQEFASKKALDTFVKDNFIADFEVEKWRELAKPMQAVWNLRDMLQTILDGTKHESGEIFLSGGNNYRYTIFPEYKSNRNKSHRPYYEKLLKDTLIEQYNAQMTIDEEADDQLGVRQYTDWMNGNDDSIIATLDKDLKTIPGLHFNWEKGTTEDISLKAANRWFYMQVLMGDTADGVPGIYGVGPKEAEKILSYGDSPLELYNACRDAYANYDIPLETMHQYAGVLWIRREQGKNWEPPK